MISTLVFAILVLIAFGIIIWAEGRLVQFMDGGVVVAIQVLTALIAALIILQKAWVV